MKKTLVLLMGLFVQYGFAQTEKFIPATIAFYNVENLFDTLNSVDIITTENKIAVRKAITYDMLPSVAYQKYYDTKDDEFTPLGKKFWNGQRLKNKIQKLAKVLSTIGQEETKQAPAIIGLAEIENKSVLALLLQDEQLLPYQYEIIHFNSPDIRGIDVAMLYQKKRFTPIQARPFELLLKKGKSSIHTRDQLLVEGLLDGEKIFFIINHWPSRIGGKHKSEASRIAAAQLTRNIVNSILDTNILAKIVIMGDFNDDPTDKSLLEALAATGKKNDLSQEKFYNPFLPIFEKGNGTLTYRGQWYLFDQIIVSPSLIKQEYSNYCFWKGNIFSPSFLLQRTGKYRNELWRTYSFGKYTGGYSDHLPVYCILLKKP